MQMTNHSIDTDEPILVDLVIQIRRVAQNTFASSAFQIKPFEPFATFLGTHFITLISNIELFYLTIPAENKAECIEALVKKAGDKKDPRMNVELSFKMTINSIYIETIKLEYNKLQEKLTLGGNNESIH